MLMSDFCDRDKVNDFFNGMDKYVQKEIENSRRNESDRSDYNIFLALHKNSDEVKHTRFIHSLLDPNGYHYLGDEFLRKFLEACDIDDFDISNVEVNREVGNQEYGRIDLCIKNGEKCIIIENKIYAKDQNSQMERYIDYICNECNYKLKNMLFLYLSVDRESVSDNSKGTYKNSKKIAVKYIYYSKEIISWLKSCLKLKITDSLYFAINRYIDVINSIYGKYTYVKDEASYRYIEKHYDKAIEIYKNHNNMDDSVIKERISTIEATTDRIIDGFMKHISSEFKKFRRDDLVAISNINRKYRKNNTWLEIYDEAWCDDKNPQYEKFILFVVFNIDNQLFVGIDTHKNMYRKGLKWQEIWSMINPKDVSYGKKNFLLYEKLKINENVILDVKEDFAKAILKKEISASELSKSIKRFVDKHKDTIIKINNNKKDKFWKMIGE